MSTLRTINSFVIPVGRHEERKRAMIDLINMTRKGGNGARWDEHFKTLLLLLLETLGDQDVSLLCDCLMHACAYTTIHPCAYTTIRPCAYTTIVVKQESNRSLPRPALYQLTP